MRNIAVLVGFLFASSAFAIFQTAHAEDVTVALEFEYQMPDMDRYLGPEGVKSFHENFEIKITNFFEKRLKYWSFSTTSSSQYSITVSLEEKASTGAIHLAFIPEIAGDIDDLKKWFPVILSSFITGKCSDLNGCIILPTELLNEVMWEIKKYFDNKLATSYSHAFKRAVPIAKLDTVLTDMSLPPNVQFDLPLPSTKHQKLCLGIFKLFLKKTSTPDVEWYSLEARGIDPSFCSKTMTPPATLRTKAVRYFISEVPTCVNTPITRANIKDTTIEDIYLLEILLPGVIPPENSCKGDS